MTEAVLGLSAYYHDSAAAILMDGEIVAAAHEERFTRKKHDASFPTHAVKYVLKESGIHPDELCAIAFYDKPFLKFERLLETYHGFAPKGLISFLSAMPVWIKEKLFMRKLLREQLKKIGIENYRLLFPEHHLSHAASAFYPSPFNDAAILTLDGVGEWATTTVGHGKTNTIKILREIHFPHSLGLLYSAFTYYCGFRVNSGEYKLMGLAPYGNGDAGQTLKWIQLIQDELIDIRDDGSFLLNMNFFNYATGLTMCHEGRWEKLFEIPKRIPEKEITQPYMNMALAIQQVTEKIVFRLAETAKKMTGSNYLVMSGGVALNCVANGKLLRKGIFDDIWIQPAAGDAGGAVGAAYAAWHIWKGKERTCDSKKDKMQGAYLGPQYGAAEIVRTARRYRAVYEYYPEFEKMCSDVSDILAQGNVVGWFQGRMEFGPRALGNRSILGDPRNPEMQKKLNLKIKYREGFRPFAPSVLEEEIKTYFELDSPSPYMLLVADVKKERRHPLPENYNEMELYDRLYHKRSDIPAVTHVDCSARIQSVNKNTNKRYWNLIKTFKERHGCGLLVNTSFNVRGEPLVCTPEDAYKCFMRTEMDYLIMDNYFFAKDTQPPWEEKENWRDEYELD